MDLFELVGTIAIKNSEANQALDETSQKGEKTQSKLGKAFSAVGKGAAAVGKTIGVGLAAGGTAMAGLTVKALNLSGELEQNMGGSEQVFAEYAGKMQETAQSAFSNMGLSTSDFLATANKMGALFQGAGFTIEESSGLASDAMQRAADVASIMGIDTSAAMEAIAGAAKGNFTMMDNLGVAMNDTTLNAYALEKGIKKTTQEMTNQEKIGLAMEMFMDKTAYAAGNYARENATLAGSLGTAKAALTNFLDGSGDVTQLVDAFSSAANVIVDNLSQIAPRLITGITDIVNQLLPVIPPLLNQLLPVIIEGAVSLINGLVAAFPSIITALMGALPALIAGVQQIINALIMALPQIIQALVSALPTLIPLLVNGLISMIVTLCTMLPQIIQPIIAYLPQIIISIVNALMANLPALINGAVQLVVGLVAALPQIILSLIQAMPTVITSITQGLIGALPTLLSGWTSIWDAVTSAVNVFMTNIQAVVVNLWNSIVQNVAAILSALQPIVSNAWNAIKTAVSNVLNTIKTVVSNVWNAIKTAVSNVLNTIKTVISNAWNNIKSTVSSVMDGIKSTISNVWDGIKSNVSNVVNGVKSTVSTAFNGIKSTATSVWNGIKTAIQNPIESARDLVKGAIDKIKGFFSFKITWPKIPMPKFAISPSGWKIGDLLKGSIPKLSIKWNADAMRNPMIMNQPTIFGYNPATGTLMGGGEAGSEVVTGTVTLLNLIRQAVRGENSGIAHRLDRIISLLIQFFPDALEAMKTPMMFDPDGAAIAMAPAMNKVLGKIAIQKERGR